MKKKYHLIVSIIILIPIAFAYGNASNLTDSFHFEIIEIDLKNILKATMGLYLAVICLWIYGIINNEYWKMATILNVLFMLGLGAGRLISFCIDGTPSGGLLVGTLLEFLLGSWGVYNLKKYKSEN